jgi:hypothetical protein
MTSEIQYGSRLLALGVRAFLLLAALGLAQNCAIPSPAADTVNAAATGGNVEIRPLAADAYGAGTEKSAQFAKDAATYQRLWASLIGNGTPPPVDFATESVVFVMAGQKRSGGYSVTVNGAALDGDTLAVDATVKSPPPNTIVSMALTSPYAVVAVKNRTFINVLWAP